jgi:thiol:disulfide interchange protein DsbC
MLRVFSAVFLWLSLFASVAVAGEETDQVRAALKKIIPTEPDSVVPSQLKGLYEVTYGAEVYYVSADGHFLLHGNLIDMQSGKNLTEEKRAAGRLKLINGIDESKMIIFAPKEVKHVITVFTDIDCPYCRRLHQEMAQLNGYGIEVRYMFFPRAGLNSKSYKKAVSVWCSKDRKQALTDAKLGKPLTMKKCDNPINEHMALVDKLGLTGTPTLILEDGEIVGGYVPADRLNEALKQRAKF